jgi:histidinol-phosphate aminotransferase
MIRQPIRDMQGYTPGEQPRGGEVIKLNTNENPYPPSPRVFEAIRAALTGDRLRKYPDPLGTDFRQTAGRVLGVDPDAILIGNGSDDVLTILTRAFVPEGGLVVSPTPSYILYRTLAEIQGARFQTVPYTADWRLPDPWPVRDANLTFVANPNSPSGTTVPLAELQRLVDEAGGPVVIDETYVDFA